MTTRILRRFFILPLLLTLAACAPSDKYPYPIQFVGAEDVGIRVLGLPPLPHSSEYDREINDILARQAKLSDADKATIMAEDHIQPAMLIDPVLGKGYTKEKYPALYTLLLHVSSDAWRTADTMQDYWKSTRPWMADARVALYTKRITQPSYPSGHATTNSVWAYVLGDLFPEQQDALLKRASEIGYHRVDGGAHFPHDIEGGKKLALFLYNKMKDHPQYKQELEAARVELAAVTAGSAAPAAANDNTPLPVGKPEECMRVNAGGMTMCK